MRFTLKKRLNPLTGTRHLLIPISILLALLLGAFLFLWIGVNPALAYLEIFKGAFGDFYNFSEVLVRATPLILCGLSVGLAGKMLIWNIGAEGQLVMGGVGGAGVALFLHPHIPVPITIPAMILAGFLGGALWGLIPGFLRARFGVNEIITSLMLNYVAILWLEHLYFGPWRDPKAALEKWLAEKDDLLAGRTPRPKTDGVTLRDLANRYLTSKKALADNGELALRTYGSYFVSARNVLAALGKDRLLTDLAADDFVHLRKSLATTLGPVALGNEINRVRMLFKFAFDTMLIDRPVRFGPGFKKPSAKTIRIARAEAGPKMFEAQELRAILEAAPAHVRAMALLGINCGYGNSDCARLPTKALDLERG